MLGLAGQKLGKPAVPGGVAAAQAFERQPNHAQRPLAPTFSLNDCPILARPRPMRTAFFALLLSLAVNAANALTKQERREFLDAIRPIAAMKAGQPIRFKVLNLNIDSGWAVLLGELVGEEGKAMDWRKANGCDENLDKSLWVVAQRHGQGWQVKEISVCSPEPPYWSLNPKAAYSLPCGIYAGLKITDSQTAEDECRAHQNKHPTRRESLCGAQQ